MDIYLEKIRMKRKESLGVEPCISRITVRGTYEFDLILVTREGDYVKAWDEKLRGRYEKFTDKHVDRALRILRGEVIALDEFSRVTLNHFIPKES